MSEGFIQKIDARDTKFGKYYDIYIDGKKLSAGKFPPKGVSAGDYVRYEIETNERGYEALKSGSMEKIEKPAGIEAPKPPKASTITIDRQDVISRQSALNSAIDFLTLLQAADALPAGAKNLTPDKKADKIEAILMEYVQRFYYLNTMTPYEIPEAMVDQVAAGWDEQE
jgi:hypothetical protein